MLPPDNGMAPIARTALQQPVPNSDRPLAEKLLQEAFSLAGNQGTGVALSNAIERSADRASQLLAVKAYWQLALAQGDASFAAQEQSWITQVPQPQAADKQAVLRAAQYAAAARNSEAKLALTASMHDFAEAAQRTETDVFFVPTDTPFTGAYRTNFRALFSGREAPAALVRIEKMLPLHYELTTVRAESVESSALALESVDAAYRKGQATVIDLLAAFNRLQEQRIAFLQAVGEYNYSIADFALAVAGPSIGRDAVISMLIERQRPAGAINGARTADVRGVIRRTSAEVPLGVDQSVLVRGQSEPTPALGPIGPNLVGPAYSGPESAGPLSPVNPVQAATFEQPLSDSPQPTPAEAPATFQPPTDQPPTALQPTDPQPTLADPQPTPATEPADFTPADPQPLNPQSP